jgi:hypothetical protein
MEKQDVINLIVQVLEKVSKKHEVGGRHELNRTDLEATLAEIRAEKPVVGEEKISLL